MREQERADSQAALTLEIDGDGVAWLVFDRPDSRVNILTQDVMARLNELIGELDSAARAGGVRAVIVRSGKEGAFIAGADVNAIASITDERQATEQARLGQSVFTRLERLDVPTIAAIDGHCLGGGTELVLACDYRLASDRPETKIGLPEVQLGILPAFGGTTRLPRLIGIQAALGMILTGKPVNARRAQRSGLIDERVPKDLLYMRAAEAARELAGGKRRPKGPSRSLLARALESNPAGRRILFWQARKQVMKQTGGHYPAPLEVLRTVRRSHGLSLDDALDVEARAVGRLVVSDISKHLIHVFHLMEAAKKAPPSAAPPRKIEHVAVLGAGVMGGGIGQLLAHNDIRVRLKDVRAEGITQGLRHARELFDKQVARGRLDRREARQRMDHIAPTLDYTGFATVDLAIEAVVERMDVKQQVLREVEERVRPECILTSNTSSLSITTMQRALEHPARFCGMHFFNPVHRMPLVEVVRGADTSDETVATVFALSRRLGKVPVVVDDGPGFLVNRVLAPYLNEAGWLLADGASVEAVDKVLKAFGMPMGPFRLLDEVGLDVARHAGATMHEAFGERLEPAPALRMLESSGLLGRKGGVGFYAYEKGREKSVHDEIYGLAGAPAERGKIDASEIRDRCVLVMVNEAARILEDGIAASPGDVDLAMIMGTGFPPFRGGLLRYADSRGTAEVLAALRQLESRFGARFTPAPHLVSLAGTGSGFYDRLKSPVA
jgi:3-hydroxyacyl-CoA dehydrogenase / enoyl-CoA hydratase / 3-hydroxybutyryl-CoA epimerase